MVYKSPQYLAFEQGKQQRDLPAELENTKNRLKEELVRFHFIVSDQLFLDEQRHLQNKGKLNEWSYVTSYQKKKEGCMSLKCSIQLTHAAKQFDISIPVKKIKRKTKK